MSDDLRQPAAGEFVPSVTTSGTATPAPTLQERIEALRAKFPYSSIAREAFEVIDELQREMGEAVELLLKCRTRFESCRTYGTFGDIGTAIDEISRATGQPPQSQSSAPADSPESPA